MLLSASALVPQVLKSDAKEEKLKEDSESADENAGLSLVEIHKKKIEKGEFPYSSTTRLFYDLKTTNI